jgi:translation initiation factor IF-1
MGKVKEMLPGKDFKIKLDTKAITEITDRTYGVRTTDFAIQLNREDLTTVLVIKALEEYLRDHRCEPDFELVVK